MSDENDLIEIPSFELDLGDDSEASLGDLRAAAQDGEESGEAEEFDVESFLAEETNPQPPEPILPKKAAPAPMSKDSTLDKMEPTDRKYVHAKAGMHPSVLPYFGHTYRS